MSARDMAEDCARLALNHFGAGPVTELHWQHAVKHIAEYLSAPTPDPIATRLAAAEQLLRDWMAGSSYELLEMTNEFLLEGKKT